MLTGRAAMEARKGPLMLRLRVGVRLVAILYGMRDGRTAYWYLTGFDTGAAEMSPGTLLMARAAELAGGRAHRGGHAPRRRQVQTSLGGPPALEPLSYVVPAGERSYGVTRERESSDSGSARGP